MGTIFHRQIDRVADLPAAISALIRDGRNIYAVALDQTAVKLGAVALNPGDGIVIGNEGHGLSADTISACTGCLYIPMAEGIESLNAAMAAGILMWETVRS